MLRAGLSWSFGYRSGKNAGQRRHEQFHCGNRESECILIFGYNAADSPSDCGTTYPCKPQTEGAKIIVCDPRVIESARIADIHLRLKNGSNMALVNAMLHVLIEENLYDKEYVANYSEGFDKMWETVSKYTPENTAEITGLDPKVVREAVRYVCRFALFDHSVGDGSHPVGTGCRNLYGVVQYRCYYGQSGRPNVGVGPVRGQNNVQGSCDMGAVPGQFPGYRVRRGYLEIRAKFEKAWGVEKLPAKKGIPITEVGQQYRGRQDQGGISFR